MRGGARMREEARGGARMREEARGGARRREEVRGDARRRTRGTGLLWIGCWVAIWGVCVGEGIVLCLAVVIKCNKCK